MKYSAQIKPISSLKAHTAEIVSQLEEGRVRPAAGVIGRLREKKGQRDGI